MALIKPRLTDFHDIHLPQSKVDFAIPFFDEDIPLYVDPFLLWKAPSQQDKSLHFSIINALNNIGYLSNNGKEDEAIFQLISASECDEVGMGVSGKRLGKRIGRKKASEILDLFHSIPAYKEHGFVHVEEIHLYVDGFSKDRISDFACSFLKSFLIDYTIDQCEQHDIPMQDITVKNIYDMSSFAFIPDERVKLPVNPQNSSPILFVPKRWLRFNPWINFDDYYKAYCPMDDKINPDQKPERVKVLNYNRNNYGAVAEYIKAKERTAKDCTNDPLFKQIPVTSAKRKMTEINKLNTGKDDNADKRYEDLVCQLMASLLYPYLDFAEEQSRTESGVLIRDIIFYNNREHIFLGEIFDEYESKQVVMEIKNVKSVDRDHINQLNRYMTDELGKFGVLITRNTLTKPRMKNTIDLWAGQRRCIITITDADLEQMVELFDSGQRTPLDVLKKKYVEFRRKCPS